MRPSLRISPATLIFAALFVAAAPHGFAQAATGTAPATYKVNLTPPLKVGQKFNYVTDVGSNMNVNMVISAPGLPAPQTQQQKQVSNIHLEADCEVLAITAQGQPKKLALTIKSLTATQDGQSIPGLPASGAVITAEQTDKHTKTFTLGDKPLDANISKLLGAEVPVEWDGHDNQTMFGPKNPVAIGDTWPANTTMVAELQDDLPGTSAINGNMKLDGITGTGDNQVAKISGNLVLVGAQVPLGPGMNVPADCTMQINATAPAVAKGVVNATVVLTAKFNGTVNAPGGASLKLNGTAGQTQTETITFH